MEFKKELQIANLDLMAKRLNRIFNQHKPNNSLLETFIAKGITWHCGGMSDPFQPINSTLKVTNEMIDITNKYAIPILFSTKSDSIHNADIRKDLHTFQLSISNIDNRKDIEPNVPSIESRLKFYKELKQQGFKVGIRIQPFIPNLTNLNIVKEFGGAEHYTLEGLKIVPQNREQREELMGLLGLGNNQFIQKGMLTLEPQIRQKMYQPFIEYFESHNISYSIADNDMRSISNNSCCCGDKLVTHSTTFNTTAMIRQYGVDYSLSDVLGEIDKCGVGDCKCYHLFTSNRTNGCVTIADFYNERFGKCSSPFSPKYQLRINDNAEQLTFDL